MGTLPSPAFETATFADVDATREALNIRLATDATPDTDDENLSTPEDVVRRVVANGKDAVWTRGPAINRSAQDIATNGWTLFDFINPAIHSAIRGSTDLTDLTTSIQSALDSGEEIKAGRGRYYFSGVDISAKTRLRGEGKDKTTFILASGANRSAFKLPLTDTAVGDFEQPVLEHFFLNANGNGQSGASYGIELPSATFDLATSYGSAVTMNGVQVESAKSGCLFAGANRNAAFINDCIFRDALTDVVTINGYDWRIKGGDIGGSGVASSAAGNCLTVASGGSLALLGVNIFNAPEIGVAISSLVNGYVDIIGCSLDLHGREGLAASYTAGQRIAIIGGRIGGNSKEGSGLYSHVRFTENDTAHSILGTVFERSDSPAKHIVEFQGTCAPILFNAVYSTGGSAPYDTDFTNDLTRIKFTSTGDGGSVGANDIVRNDVEQDFTPALKAQAQANIGLDWISVLNFVPKNLHAGIALRTITTDLTTYLDDAADAAAGKGILHFPPGLYPTTGWTVGDGSNSQQSTKHHKLWVVGAGMGGAPSLSAVQADAGTCIRYIGATSTSAAVMSLAGPIHNIQLSNLQLDCDGKAGIGLLNNNVTDFKYERLQVLKFTAAAYLYTTRTGLIIGAPYGCSNGTQSDCYSYDPANNTADAIVMTSGVSTASALAGNVDTANVDVLGGLYFYGGSAGSAGIRLAGADNNTFRSAQFLPAGGNDGGGKSVVFEQWAGEPGFPKQNVFDSLGLAQPVSGTSGTGGNTFIHHQPDDGCPVPTLDYINTRTHDGQEYVNGVRIYRSLPQAPVDYYGAGSTTSTSYSDVAGLSKAVTTRGSSKLRVAFQALVAKSTSGSGSLIINVDGTDYGVTEMRVTTKPDYETVSAQLLLDVAAGAHTVKLRFKSSDANTFTVALANLNVDVLI